MQKFSHFGIHELRVVAASLQLRSADIFLLLERYAGVRTALGYCYKRCGFSEIIGRESLDVLDLWRGESRVAFEIYCR